jgi:hypothetical protein
MRPSTTALATLAALTLSPALASAGDPGALLKYAPRDSGMIAGFDGEASRGTASFKEGFKLLKRDAGFRKVARTLKKELNFDVAKDLDTGLIATPKVKGTGKRASRTFTLVVSGSIDRAATEAALAKNGKPSTISGVSVFKTTKGATVSFLDDSTMVVVAGGDDYTARAWSTVAGKTKGADSGADLAAELSSVDTSRNAWMVADASKVRQPPGANVERLALTVSFAGGLSVDSALQMGSAGQAAKAATAFEDNRFKSSMMAAAFAAHPLINNAKVSASGSTLTLKTSMTDTEVRAVGARVREIEEQKRLQREEAKRKEKEAAKAAP